MSPGTVKTSVRRVSFLVMVGPLLSMVPDLVSPMIPSGCGLPVPCFFLLPHSSIGPLEDGLGEDPKYIDFYFFGHGFNYKQALKDFTTIAGPIPYVPKYSLGTWYSRYHAYFYYYNCSIW